MINEEGIGACQGIIAKMPHKKATKWKESVERNRFDANSTESKDESGRYG